MITLEAPGPHNDDHGNRIGGDALIGTDAKVIFRGENNVLEVAPGVDIGYLKIVFCCNNGYCRIGSGYNLCLDIRVGEDCSIVFGDGLSCTGTCYVSAAEGASVNVGRDCMLARENEIRADDAHPIFNIHDGKRVNPSRSIDIGEHVWLADRAVVLSGSRIDNGSVIGFGSLVKGNIPNNCIAVGSPARVIRTDCAWERDHLNLTKPHYKSDATCVNKSLPYWKPTSGEQ